MNKKDRLTLCLSISFNVAFILWTVAICFIDVKAIGPQSSSVGFATLNSFIHNVTGVNYSLYVITDWLGLVPICFCIGFAILGVKQWIQRKKILKVDYSLFVLGSFYIVVFLIYFLFETFNINYRPVLINGYLEKSYPSSTTLLVLCVMSTAIMQFNSRIKNKRLKNCLSIAIFTFITFMVLGRLISGVHWLTDIIGGILLSVGLITAYDFVANIKSNGRSKTQ